MLRFELRPLDDGLLPAAAALLRERHERALAAQPRQSRPTSYGDALRAELAHDGAAGLVAVDADGRARACLVVRPDGDDRMGAEHNRRMLAGVAGVAADDADALRAVYTAHAAEYAGRGVHRHVLMVPESDALVREVLGDLAFGVQYRWGVRDVGPTPPGADDVLVRAAEPGDLRALAVLDRELRVLQAESPSFSGLVLPSVEAFEAEWSDLWDDADELIPFVAERGGEVVGDVLLYRRPIDLRVPGGNIDLAHAATLPAHRGTGVMSALLGHAMAWAAEHGFTTITTDWRTVNLLSSRFWGRAGFEPTFVRLYRGFP